jgi:6-phosphogluconate dehydrogenase
MTVGENADLGVVGLAVMGANLARNAASRGFGVALFNRHPERTDALIREHGSEGRFVATKSLPEFVAALKKPRIALVMVQAGKPVDDMIDELMPHLEPDDILIDGGNSLFTDTIRRVKACEAKGVRFVGMGVSGGEEGALKGPSMMPGGDRAAYDRIAPYITKMAAQAYGRPCCAYIGPDGAGHYVKMVHNGIEYADMQLIAETYDILKSVYGLPAAAIGDVFAGWKSSSLDSYLIDITTEVLHKTDDTGSALVDHILDEAEQKGTGRWTAQSALELGVPITAITEAVYARALSSQRELRATAERHFPHPPVQPRKASPAELEALRDALYASKIVAYAQGFEQMAVASAHYQWGLNLSEIAAIWRGGCIIRARMLDRVMEAYEREPPLESLLLADHFRDAIVGAEGAWRQAVSLAIAAGVPAPAFSSTLAYYDGIRRARGPANLLQGLRDYFGAHTYRRLDKPGVFHTRWAQDGAEVKVG